MNNDLYVAAAFGANVALSGKRPNWLLFWCTLNRHRTVPVQHRSLREDGEVVHILDVVWLVTRPLVVTPLGDPYGLAVLLGELLML